MGTRYDEAARLTGGVSGNICNADFTEIISELSLASSRLSERFALSELPDPRTLEVVFDEETTSDQATVLAAPDVEEHELSLQEKEELRTQVGEAVELLEALVDTLFEEDDSDSVVRAVSEAVVDALRGHASIPHPGGEP